MQLVSALCTGAMIVHFILGLLVFLRSPHKSVNQIFGLLLFLFFVWSMTELIILLNGVSLFLIKILLSTTILLSYFFAWFIAIFPKKVTGAAILAGGIQRVICVSPAILLLVLLWADQLIERLDSVPFGFLVSFGKFEFIAKGIFVGYLLLSLKIFTMAKKNIDSELSERRFRYTFIGLVLPVAGGSLFMAIGRWFLGVPGMIVYTIGIFPTFGIFMAGFLSYAILRLKLLEIDLILSVGLVYSCLTFFFAGVLELLENALQNVLNLSGTWATIFSTLVIAGFFSPIRDLIGRLVDYLFGKRNFDIALVIRDLLSKMRQAQSSQQVLDQFIHESRNILDFSCAIISMDNGLRASFPDVSATLPTLPKVWMQLNDLDSIIEAGVETGSNDFQQFAAWRELGYLCAFPIPGKDKIAGAFFLGSKANKLPYSQEEKNLVASLCHQIPSIFENLQMLETIIKRDRNQREIEWTHHMYKSIQADTSLKEFNGYPIRLFSSLSETIKGDLINIFEDSRKFYVTICDAFNQGIQAALTLHIVNSAIRASTKNFEQSDKSFDPFPAIQSVLSGFSNPSLCSAVTFIEICGPNIRIANAGNPSPMLIYRNGKRSFINEKGKPLGIMPHFFPTFSSVSILPGDFVFCSTNGLLKAFENEKGTPFEEFLSEIGKGGIEDFHQAIQKALLEMANRQKLQDDVTYVLLEGKFQEVQAS